MPDLTQIEKELVITSLGNSLQDIEQSDIHPDVADLYDKLRLEWLADPSGYHSAKEIIDNSGG